MSKSNLETILAKTMTYLSRAFQAFDHLLHCTSAVHVLRDAYQIVRYTLNKEQALLLLAVFQKLLAKIITKRI